MTQHPEKNTCKQCLENGYDECVDFTHGTITSVTQPYFCPKKIHTDGICQACRPKCLEGAECKGTCESQEQYVNRIAYGTKDTCEEEWELNEFERITERGLHWVRLDLVRSLLATSRTEADQRVKEVVREERERVKEEVEKMKLPYGYKSQSPFGGEGVEYHLRKYGHLPELGCCRYDQFSDEKTDIYNQALADLSANIK